jgi:predicted amidohydrolase
VSARPRSVAALQLHAHDRADFSERWPHILARIAHAADNGADLIIVPEGTVPAYVIGTHALDPRILDAAAQDVIAIAQRSGATIVYGGARYDEEQVVNSAYVVTADGIIGTADKCFLWHFDRRWFRAGTALEPIDTPAGRLGVFVCADGRIPTISSTLVDRGAEILVLPTAWVTSGRDPAVLENLQADLMVNVRARENGVPLVAANKVGIEARSVAYCGKSAIIDAEGTFVARASQNEETTLQAHIAVGPSIVKRNPTPNVARGSGMPVLTESVRIAITPTRSDIPLHELARLADADFIIDPHMHSQWPDVAIVQDEAMLDPRALIAPRLDGTRLFIWHASIDPAWLIPFARTRAAELRAYIVVLDTRDARAFAVDPDGTILCGTFGTFEIAAFAFDRRKTDAWTVAPHTDIKAGLLAVEAMQQ